MAVDEFNNWRDYWRHSIIISCSHCDTPDPPGHIRLNSKVIKGEYDAQGSKRGVEAKI